MDKVQPKKSTAVISEKSWKRKNAKKIKHPEESCRMYHSMSIIIVTLYFITFLNLTISYRIPMYVFSKRQKFDHMPSANLDADDPIDDDEDDDDEDDSDDDADTAQLLAELSKIKKERATELAKKVTI